MVYIGSINDIEVGLDILLKSENRKKEIYSFEPCLSIFNDRFLCFVLESRRQSEDSLFFMEWNSSDWPGGCPTLLRQRLMKRLGSHDSGLAHVT